MPFEPPPNPADPDEGRAESFVLVSQYDPELAHEMIDFFLSEWLTLAELRPDKNEDPTVSVELRVANFDKASLEEAELRLTSFYTGSTYYLPEWDGTYASAVDWLQSVAELQASNAMMMKIYGPRYWEANPRFQRRK